MGRGVEEVKIAIPDEADETAEERKLNKFTESTEAMSPVDTFFFHRDTIIMAVSQVEKQNIKVIYFWQVWSPGSFSPQAWT